MVAFCGVCDVLRDFLVLVSLLGDAHLELSPVPVPCPPVWLRIGHKPHGSLPHTCSLSLTRWLPLAPAQAHGVKDETSPADLALGMKGEDNELNFSTKSMFGDTAENDPGEGTQLPPSELTGQSSSAMSA